MSIARNRLRAAAGSDALVAIDDAFAKANKYSRWTGWSIDPIALYWLGTLIVSENIRSIVEFGAGYSTIVLAEFLNRIAPNVLLTSFEHQHSYFERLIDYIPDRPNIILHHAELIQLDTHEFRELFTCNNPFGLLHSKGKTVPPEQLHQTRIQNAFYKIEQSQFDSRPVDLVILDGPNGSGRSAAFPLLKNIIAKPAWMLLDDYLDYPFIEELQQIFEIETHSSLTIIQQEFMLVRLRPIAARSGKER